MSEKLLALRAKLRSYTVGGKQYREGIRYKDPDGTLAKVSYRNLPVFRNAEELDVVATETEQEQADALEDEILAPAPEAAPEKTSVPASVAKKPAAKAAPKKKVVAKKKEPEVADVAPEGSEESEDAGDSEDPEQTEI